VLRAILGPLAILSALATAAAAGEERPRAFLELFTSQGCAACPPADDLLGALSDEEDVLAVTMPVKLWDFLGWRDTLATDALTKRQIAYSVARGDRDVYTPQMIVNGETDVLGSDRTAIEDAIRSTGAGPLPLPIELASDEGILSVRVGDADVKADRASLWLLVVDEEVEVPISKGENRGRHLTYHNVVRHMRPIGMWKGEPLSIDLPLSDVEKNAEAGCFVIAQVESFKGPGRIIGAAELKRLFPARKAKPSAEASPSGAEDG